MIRLKLNIFENMGFTDNIAVWKVLSEPANAAEAKM